MMWFTAIGAVIVLGAVAGATWNQHKGRCCFAISHIILG